MPRSLYLVIRLEDEPVNTLPSASHLQDMVESMDLVPGLKLKDYAIWSDDSAIVKGHGYRL